MKTSLVLSDWMQRRTYFTGRFYQEDVEDLLSLLLREGDNFVDVGANIGLITLHAASLVGARGSIWSFEPSPLTYKTLKYHIELNGLESVHAFNKGLGSKSDTLQLRQMKHSGQSTLVAWAGSKPSSTIPVAIERGDIALKGLDTSKPTVVKIDVEGFESEVLKGLDELLKADVAVVVEVSRDWLKAAGSSTEELHGIMSSFGFKPFSFLLEERRLHRGLVIRPLSGPLADDQYDCLFMRTHSIFKRRLEC